MNFLPRVASLRTALPAERAAIPKCAPFRPDPANEIRRRPSGAGSAHPPCPHVRKAHLLQASRRTVPDCWQRWRLKRPAQLGPSRRFTRLLLRYRSVGARNNHLRSLHGSFRDQTGAADAPKAPSCVALLSVLRAVLSAWTAVVWVRAHLRAWTHPRLRSRVRWTDLAPDVLTRSLPAPSSCVRRADRFPGRCQRRRAFRRSQDNASVSSSFLLHFLFLYASGHSYRTLSRDKSVRIWHQLNRHRPHRHRCGSLHRSPCMCGPAYYRPPRPLPRPGKATRSHRRGCSPTPPSALFQVLYRQPRDYL